MLDQLSPDGLPRDRGIGRIELEICTKWVASVHMPTPNFLKDFDELCALFSAQGIPMVGPGFYDHPNFLMVERSDPTFLNCYARFVQQRPRDETYEARVRRVVPRVAEILHRELEAEGRLGACIDLSMVLSRILDAEGIWNYMVKGSLTLTFPRSVRPGPIYFWPMDEGDFEAGHVWISAPPYDVIDLTVRQQPYPKPAMRRMLAPYVALDTITSVAPTIVDIVSEEIQMQVRRQRGYVPPDLHFHLNPILRDVFVGFPANEKRIGRVRMRYVPCAFSASNEPLEEITNQRWNGRYGFEIYRDMIKGQT